MRKQQILGRMSKIINKGRKRVDRINKDEIEKVIEVFKQVMLECIANGEDFDYHGFLEVDVTTIEPKERVNPKSQETFLDHKKYKANIKFKYSVKQFIKKIVAK